MKKNFTTPSMDVLLFELENIVLTSGMAVQSVFKNDDFNASEEHTTVTVWTEMIQTTL